MRRAILARPIALSLIALASILAGASTTTAQSANPQIVITVHSVKPLDKYDELSLGDLFARMTIGGQSTSTEILKQTTQPGVVIRPKWILSQSVAPGKHTVKFEFVDKDITVDDVIDINRLDKRRELEFDVDTRSCRISGFSSPQRCKARNTRTGKEKKAAEVTFSVDVKK
jgi:hypothetical protein